jgi:protein TonB
MKKNLLSLLFLATVAFAKAQPPNYITKMVPTDPARIFTSVEVEPTPSGGIGKLHEYILKNERAGDNEGKVRVSFIVEKGGNLSEIKIEQSLSKSADEEAIRLVSQMPKWNPGIQGGHPVRVKYSIPINFPTR